MKNINAVEDPWILVSSGEEISEASIRNIFQAESKISGLAEGYWKGIAPLRLLVAIAMSALKPKNDDEIIGYLDNLPDFCEKIQKYLDQWKDSFWLFHKEKPFLQVAFLKTDYPFQDSNSKGFSRKATNELVLSEGLKTAELRSPSSKNPTETLSGILRALLYSQILGGNMKYGISRPGGPELKPKGQVKAFQSIPSISLTTNGGSTSTLNIHPYDPYNLLISIILNMLSQETTDLWSMGIGKPLWEYCIWNDHEQFLKNTPILESSFLGRIVPINKFIWIDPEAPNQMVYSDAEGINYLEPLLNLKLTGKRDQSYYLPSPKPRKGALAGKATLGYLKENSFLWKEFATLDTSVDIPEVLKKFQILKKFKNKIIISATTLNCSGSRGLVYGEKIIVSSLSWNLNDLKDYLKGNLGILNSMVEKAEEVKLYNATFKFNIELGLDPDSKTAKGNTNQVSSYYWSHLNSEFQYFLNKINEPETNNDWNLFIKKTAIDALHTLKDSDPRRNKAVVRAIKVLK